MLRWSIPGALLLLIVFLDELLIVLVFERHRASAVVTHHLSGGVVAFFIAIGIPVGFLMNQIYYYVWDEMLLVSSRLPVPHDRGREILLQLRPQQVAILKRHGLPIDLSPRTVPRSMRYLLVFPKVGRLFLSDPAPASRTEYRRARRQNWRAVRWLMTYGTRDELRDVVLAAYTARAETYHALGGCRYAVLTGTVGCALYNLVRHADAVVDKSLRFALVTFLWAASSGAIAYLLLKVRSQTSLALQETLIDGLLSAVPG